MSQTVYILSLTNRDTKKSFDIAFTDKVMAEKVAGVITAAQGDTYDIKGREVFILIGSDANAVNKQFQKLMYDVVTGGQKDPSKN